MFRKIHQATSFAILFNLGTINVRNYTNLRTAPLNVSTNFFLSFTLIQKWNILSYFRHLCVPRQFFGELQQQIELLGRPFCGELNLFWIRWPAQFLIIVNITTQSGHIFLANVNDNNLIYIYLTINCIITTFEALHFLIFLALCDNSDWNN